MKKKEWIEEDKIKKKKKNIQYLINNKIMIKSIYNQIKNFLSFFYEPKTEYNSF